MIARSRSYDDGLYRRLKDDAEAAYYLEAAFEDSPATFHSALRNVLEARALESGVDSSQQDHAKLENVLSESAITTQHTLEEVLRILGLHLAEPAAERLAAVAEQVHTKAAA